MLCGRFSMVIGLGKIFFFKENVFVLDIFQAVVAQTIRVSLFGECSFFHGQLHGAAMTMCHITHFAFKGLPASRAYFLFMCRHHVLFKVINYQLKISPALNITGIALYPLMS